MGALCRYSNHAGAGPAKASFETTLHEEDFTMVSGYAELGPTHDAAGDLTYDGVHAFTYDAWNRLRTVTKAYRAPGSAPGTGDIELAAVVSQSQYDPLGRRTVKAVTYSADLDGTYHYYYSAGGHSLIEERDGSDNVLRQNVWGLMYIDELIQTSLNDDPEDLAEQAVESHYFALHNTQFNVMALADATGALVERYEYTPYGQRAVYMSSGTNDPLAMAPTSMSQRVKLPGGGGVAQPYGLNPIGHQGLYHDEETSSGSGSGGGLIYNRARMLHTRMARFMQRDPLGYVDGMSTYAYYAGMRGGVDPGGMAVGHVVTESTRPDRIGRVDIQTDLSQQKIDALETILRSNNNDMSGITHIAIVPSNHSHNQPLAAASSAQLILVADDLMDAAKQIEYLNLRGAEIHYVNIPGHGAEFRDATGNDTGKRRATFELKANGKYRHIEPNDPDWKYLAEYLVVPA